MVSVMLDKTGLDYINDRIRNTIREIPFKDLLFVHLIAICVLSRDSCRTEWINRISQGNICSTGDSGLLRCGTWQESVVRRFEIVRIQKNPLAMVILESFVH